MNFHDKLNNLQNNNDPNYNVDFNIQNKGNSLYDYPESQWRQQNQQNIQGNTPYNKGYGNAPYNQGYDYPPSYNQAYSQPHNYAYGETSFESRNIIRQMNQYDNPIDNASTKQLGKRFLAGILDGILSSIPSLLLALLFIVPSLRQVLNTVSYIKDAENAVIMARQLLAGKIVSLLIINFIVLTVYYIIIPAYVLQGRTVGKKLMKLRIVTIEEEIPGVITLIKREILGKFLSAFCLIGYFMILFSRNHSALHDRIAQTKVIDDDELY